MNGADIAILAVLGVSVLFSLFRGFIREVFSVLVWAVAIIAALQVAGPFARVLEAWIEMPSARLIFAFVAVFVFVLVIGAVFSFALGRLIENTDLSPTDRLFGGVFGLMRGLAIVLALVMVARFTPFPADPWWQESRLLPEFERLAEWTMDYMPESVQTVLAASRQSRESG